MKRITLAILILLMVVVSVYAYGVHDWNGQYATMDYADFVIGGWPATGGGAMTVTAPYAAGVSPSNVLTNRYSIDTYRKTIHWVLDLTDLNIGGTRTNQFIALKIPEGKYANATVQKSCLASDNNGTASWYPCYFIQSEWLQYLYVRRIDQQNWPATTTLRLDIDTIIEYVDQPPQ